MLAATLACCCRCDADRVHRGFSSLKTQVQFPKGTGDLGQVNGREWGLAGHMLCRSMSMCCRVLPGHSHNASGVWRTIPGCYRQWKHLQISPQEWNISGPMPRGAF